jgi:hypothetical protein
MKEAISKLKDTVKQLAAGGSAIAAQIREAKGLDRYHLWNEKRYHGDSTRNALLAYACLRGRAYETVERKVREGNFPSATAVRSHLLDALDDAQKVEWTPERVRDWLEGKASPAATEAAPTGVAA